MSLVISVQPQGDIWTVRSEVLHQELIFDKGGRAEAAARKLADQLAHKGLWARVEIYLRDGVLAGYFTHPARGQTSPDAGLHWPTPKLADGAPMAY
jgi:hypothetical protein